MTNRGRPRNYSLDAVLDAAFELAEESGVGALSMLGLAKRLGTGNATLYNYVGSRDELIELMLGRWLAEQRPVPMPSPGDDWEDAVVEYVVAHFRGITVHPVVVELSRERPQLHLGAMARSDQELAALRQLGFSAARAQEIQQILSLQLLGHLAAFVCDGEGGSAGAERLFRSAVSLLVGAFALELRESSRR